MREIDFHNEKSNEHPNSINRHIILTGLMVLKQDLKKSVRSLINTTNYAGVTVRLVSGDAYSVVWHVALSDSIGILSKCDESTNSNVIQDGKTFRNLLLNQKIDNISDVKVLARATAADKLCFIRELQLQGSKVAFVSDSFHDI